MSRQLKVIRIDGVQPEVVGTLLAGEIKIGREPSSDGIAVASNGVSREHGVFVRYRNNWFYKDYGSTNGSWIAGRAIKADRWGVIRKGTILQLADTGFTFEDQEEAGAGQQPQSLTNFPALGGRSIFVFKDGDFFEEYPIPEYGKALVVGGSEADLQLDGDGNEAPALVIERRGDDVVFYQKATERQVLKNAEACEGTQLLLDGDELEISRYWLLFNDPKVKQEAIDASTGKQFLNIRGWDDENEQAVQLKQVASHTFGAVQARDLAAHLEEEDYIAPGSGLYGTRGTGTFGAGMTESHLNQANFSSIEDRIVMGVGLAVVFAVIMLGLWWLIS